MNPKCADCLLFVKSVKPTDLRRFGKCFFNPMPERVGIKHWCGKFVDRQYAAWKHVHRVGLKIRHE